MTNFSQVLDAAANLSTDEQETLLEILRRRLAARNRERLVREVQEARRAFSAGNTRRMSVSEIMAEVRAESSLRPTGVVQ